jgi:hypothetical protein
VKWTPRVMLLTFIAISLWQTVRIQKLMAEVAYHKNIAELNLDLVVSMPPGQADEVLRWVHKDSVCVLKSETVGTVPVWSSTTKPIENKFTDAKIYQQSTGECGANIVGSGNVSVNCEAKK